MYVLSKVELMESSVGTRDEYPVSGGPALERAAVAKVILEIAVTAH
jgi:hypothetical protein